MTKINIKYNGFALGFRVADKFALQADRNNPLHERALHALKGLAHIDVLYTDAKIVGINNQVYAGE